MDDDKKKHFWTCLVIALFAGAGLGMWWGAGLALVSGVAKELCDSRPGGTGWDWMDLLADGAGTVVGLIMLLGVKHIAGV